MNEFNKTKELMEQYKDFDKQSSEVKQEITRAESLIQHLKEESENIVLEEYESQDASYMDAVQAEYKSRIEEVENHKASKEKEIGEIDKNKKYFRTDTNLKTITMEIKDIENEIGRKQRELKQVNLDIENVFAEPDPENPLKWQELYNQKDQLNREIKELEGLKEEYTNFLNELKSIELTSEEYKEMFAREEAHRKEVEEVEQPAEEVEQPVEEVENTAEEAETTAEEVVEEGEKTNTLGQKINAPAQKVQTVVRPQATTRTEVTTPQTNNATNRTTSAKTPAAKMSERKELPEITIGRKVSLKNGKDVNELKLRKLLRNDKDNILGAVRAVFQPAQLPKDLVEKLENADPVLMQAIIEYKDSEVLSKDETKKAIEGVLNKDKEALKNILKIRYDKGDLSKWSFLPWNKKQRDEMANYAEENSEIAEVVGEYESNLFKKLMKKINTKLLPSGEKGQEKQSTTIKDKIKTFREGLAYKISTTEQKKALENQAEATRTDNQRDNDNEGR